MYNVHEVRGLKKISAGPESSQVRPCRRENTMAAAVGTSRKRTSVKGLRVNYIIWSSCGGVVCIVWYIYIKRITRGRKTRPRRDSGEEKRRIETRANEMK